MFWQHGGLLVKLSSSYSRIAATSTSSSLNKRISPVSTLYRAVFLNNINNNNNNNNNNGSSSSRRRRRRRRRMSSTIAEASKGNKKKQPKEDKTSDANGKEYDPEKTAIVNGKRYRKCACAIVFNDSGSQVLVGERAGKSGSWNLPQGGMEPKETTAEAATRELYEETGISLDSAKNKNNIQVELVAVLENDDAYAYSAGGWLEKKGLAGQRLEFAVFRCKTSVDPMEFVNLEGLDGEPAEFTQMKWMSLDECVESVWEAKKKAYEKMRVNVEPIIRNF